MKSKSFGKYVLVDKLGAGGMAEVYKAYPTGHAEKPLAIKRILPQYAKNKQLVGMLVNEAKVTFGLEHPNIVPVIDFGMIDGTYFLAMEYIYGKDLRTVFLELQNKNREFPIPFAIFIVSSILKGLDYAHHKTDQFGQALQIVHRDISPQNVMISFSGTVKILDFGIAISTAKFDPTELGILKGKFSYMSPEQAYGKEVDPRSDIYSSGVVLWELLTMQSCFIGHIEVEVLNQVREASIKPPHLINTKVTHELSQIVMKAVDKRIHTRYPTAAEFSQKLDQYLLERFGSISPADIAAFLRTIFNINLDEIGADPVLIEARAAKDRKTGSKPLSEILYADDLKADVYTPPSKPAPWTKKKASIWTWDLLLIPASIFLIGMMMTWLPLEPMWSKIRSLLESAPPTTSDPSEAFPDILPTPKKLYEIQFSKEARAQLEALPFETFEAVRNQVLDLANLPKPSQAKRYSKKTMDWMVSTGDKRIVYEVDEKRKSIVVKKIF